MNTTFDWPPQYTLRHSLRARSVRLQICKKRGLQIIVPRNFNLNKAPEILQKHRRWIERAWQRVQPTASTTLSEALPTQIALLAIDQIWQIHYESNDANLLRIEMRDDQQLVVHGQTLDQKRVLAALRRWLQRRAVQHLPIWLEKLSQQTELHYSHVSIRNTTTRWGSCSAKKSISLNCKLLFLPPTLVEHVLLHELCHTIHLNHSKRFWALLKKLNPDCHNLRIQLKQAQRYIPNWME